MDEPQASKTDDFLGIATRLDLLTHDQAEALKVECAASAVSPAQVAVQKGLLDPIKLDMIETLRRPTEVVPGYELLDVLGHGGMGVVYRARQTNLNRQVAIKTILIHRMEDQGVISRFEQEARVLAQLSHPNIVGAYDYGRHGGRLYFVMEYIHGSNLDQRLDECGSLTEWEAWGLARQAASGLAHAAEHDIVHRDIKPANLLLVDPPTGMQLSPGLKMVKIADFGLARLIDEHDSRTRITTDNAAVGSPQYMAPEQLQGGSVDFRADIYALGATVYHLLTGVPPFRGGLTQVLTQKVAGKYTPLNEVKPTITSSSRKLIEQMLSLSRDDRPRDYAQLIQEIDRILARVEPLLTTTLTMPATLDEDDADSTSRHAAATRDTETALLPGATKTPSLPGVSTTDDIARMPTAVATADATSTKRAWIMRGLAGMVILSLILLPWFLPARAPVDSNNAPIELEPELLEPASPPRSLYNGRDLTGWNYEPGVWRAIPEEGVIAGASTEIWTTLFESRSNRRPIEFYRLECVVQLHEADEAAVMFGVESGHGRDGRCHVLSVTASGVKLLERTLAGDNADDETVADLPIGMASTSEVLVRLERQPKGWFIYLNDEFQGGIPHREVPDLPEFRFAAVGGEAWFSDVVLTALSDTPVE